jgi:adenosylhomocysteine nucleosidase
MAWGILGAVEEEVWALIDNMTGKQEQRWNKRSIYSGRVGDREIVVMSTGVGKVSTAASVQYLIDHFPIECIVFSGVAGAVNPDLKVGDIVIGLKTIQHDFDIGGWKIFSQMKTPWFETDSRLVELAVRTGSIMGLGDRVKTGIILTGDQTIISSDQREWLRTTFGGDCVEMEGAAAALVSARNRTPFLLVRTITDFADENAREDFRSSMSQAARDSGRFVLGMLGKTRGVKFFRRSPSFRIKKIILRHARRVFGKTKTD